MFSYSKVGIAILVLMVIFSIMELVRLIKSFNKDRCKVIPVHIIGVSSGILMTVFTVALLLEKNIFTKTVIYIGLALVVVCFLVVGYNSLVVEVNSKPKGGKRAYKKRKPPKSECL